MRETPPRMVGVYGLALSSELPLTTHLRPAEGTPDLCLRLGEETSDDPGPLAGHVHSSPLRLPDGRPALRVRSLGDALEMDFPGCGQFVLAGQELALRPAPQATSEWLEVRLLGPVLSLALEARGVLALHAAAVEGALGAVGFLSTNRGGKSWLAAACLRAGHRLLTDDILPVEATGEGFLARPGPPEMRLTAEGARLFGLNPEELAPVLTGLPKLRAPVQAGVWGEACPDPLPLRVLYLPRRVEGLAAPRVTPVTPVQALRALVSHSFSARVVESLGWQARRLEPVSRLARQVPVRALELPPGPRYLDAAVELVRADAEGRE